jgi:UDPglucose--hexose-1-phosphate uridylyltransferase
VSGRWVIVSTDRQMRPNDFPIERARVVRPGPCPFCPGNEELTPPESLAYRSGGGAPNSPGWDVRVVPNKFPAVQTEGGLHSTSGGLFEATSGFGVHEVLIETPEHGKALHAMSAADVERILAAFAARVRVFRQDPRLRYVVLFKNQGGAAGATLEHSHAQVMALPIVPSGVRAELDGARRHFGATGRCVFCDLVREELAAGVRVVYGDADVVALSPYASRVPFEVWVVPRRHEARFEEAATGDHAGVARALKAVLGLMAGALDAPDYNLILHTAPWDEVEPTAYHWHVEILPKLTRLGGLESGTGCYINPTSPEEATRVLRGAAS